MRSMLFVPADSEKKLAKSLHRRRRRADPRSRGFGRRRPAPGRPRDGLGVHRPSARRAGAKAKLYVRINPLDSRGLGSRSRRRHGGSARTASSTRNRTPARTCTNFRSRSAMPSSEHGLKSGQTKHPPDHHRSADLGACSCTPMSAPRAASVGMSWGAEDLGAVIGSLANRDEAGQWTSPYRLVRDLMLIHGLGRRRRADRHGVCELPRHRGPDCRGAGRQARRLYRQDRHPSRTRWRRSTRCSRRSPEEVAHAKAVHRRFCGTGQHGRRQPQRHDARHAALEARPARPVARRGGQHRVSWAATSGELTQALICSRFHRRPHGRRVFGELQISWMFRA